MIESLGKGMRKQLKICVCERDYLFKDYLWRDLEYIQNDDYAQHTIRKYCGCQIPNNEGSWKDMRTMHNIQ